MNRRGSILPSLMSLLAVTAVAAAWALFLIGKGGGLPSFGPDPYEVSVVIPTGAAVAPGSRVTVAGVQVGKVKDVERQGMAAKIVLSVDDQSVVPFPADSRAAVRQHTPVGENYIAITAGDAARKLESGDAIPVSQSEEFVDVDRLLSVLKGGTRERARETIQGLGGALEDRGPQLNQLVGGGAEFLKASSKAVDVLHRDREQASRLVAQLGDLTASIGQRDAAIRTIADRGLVGLGAVRRRDAALRETIDELPSSLRRIRSTSETVGRVAAVATPVANDATAALGALQPTVARLRPASQAGREAVRELRGAAPVLEQTLAGVTKLADPLAAALPKLRKTFCEISPTLRYLQPYLREGLYIITGLSSASNSYDATGHLVRLAPIFSENSISGAPPQVAAAAETLLYGGILGQAGTSLNYDPYPAPGSLGTTVARSNAPSGPDAISGTGFKYPRIQADC